MGTLWVIAQKGTFCPRQGPFAGRISDTVPVEVQDNRFYQRMVADGSLRVLSESEAKKILNPETVTKKSGGKS